MVTFIDLTKASAPETPTRVVLQHEEAAHGSTSSLQASRFYHHPLLDQIRRGVIEVDKEIDTTLNSDRGVYQSPAVPAATRSSSAASMHRRRLLEHSPSQSKGPLPMSEQSVDGPQVMDKTSTKSRGQSTLNPASSNRNLEVNGFVELPLSQLNINGPSPSAKRRCSGLNWSSCQGSAMNMTSQLPRERELELAEEEDSIVDLTISENFPISQRRTKRLVLDLSDVSDGDEQGGTAQRRISEPVAATGTPTSLQEARARTRFAAPGIKRRLAALGRHIQANHQDIFDLSADTDSDEEEPELSRDALRRHSLIGPEMTREAAWRPNIIGPEDYLSDDEISRRLANLRIGPERGITLRQKSTLNRTEIDVISQGDFRFKAGKSVELRNGKFLRIVSVLKDKKGDVLLSGHLLSRQNSCGRVMPKRRNELVWIVEMNKEDFEAELGPKMSEINITEALRIRNVTFTNQRYPEMSIKTHRDGGFESAREEITTGPLFCRWKSIKVTADRKQRHEDSLIHLTYTEADPKPNAKVRPAIIRNMWRGSQPVLGGSHFATRHSNIDLISQHSVPISEEVQQYTFGDAFCGAGGCSTGASQAGLRVKWGFDRDKDTVKVFAANLGRREGAECLREAVDEFCGRSDIERFVVDILHMSPPCQPFSPAHTVPSEIQDEINQAALFSVWHLLEKIKPRIATIEETEGLMNRHIDWFQALINIFISLSYSVRWKVVRCQDYGVPQQRRRLLIIAAGPGEKLPPFPKPTHGEPGSGLQSFKKVMHYIRDIPPGASQHNISDRFRRGPRTPFSDDQFAKTLTCSGGVGNYHPSGLRFYTIREAASLQTFPISHTFTPDSKTKARRQIGNAVPPLLARSMYREIVKYLKEADRLEVLTEGGQV